jgi:hypothetical protein
MTARFFLFWPGRGWVVVVGEKEGGGEITTINKTMRRGRMEPAYPARSDKLPQTTKNKSVEFTIKVRMWFFFRI